MVENVIGARVQRQTNRASPCCAALLRWRLPLPESRLAPVAVDTSPLPRRMQSQTTSRYFDFIEVYLLKSGATQTHFLLLSRPFPSRWHRAAHGRWTTRCISLRRILVSRLSMQAIILAGGMSVDSRHGSVNVTLQGKHRKSPGLGCGLTSEAVAIETHGPRACWILWPRKSDSTDRSDAQLSDCGFAMSFFSPAKHARVDYRLPPVLFLRRARMASGA